MDDDVDESFILVRQLEQAYHPLPHLGLVIIQVDITMCIRSTEDAVLGRLSLYRLVVLITQVVQVITHRDVDGAHALGDRLWPTIAVIDTDVQTVLQTSLLGMNAHINYDLPISLLGVIDDAEFADPEVMAKRNRDHTHIDKVLLNRVGAEDEAITAAHGGKNTYERLKAPLERRATGRFLREARAKVWANTRLMAAARARGDAAALERLRAELARLSAAKLDELARAREVLLHLWIKGFGVRLDEPQGRGAEDSRPEKEG